MQMQMQMLPYICVTWFLFCLSWCDLLFIYLLVSFAMSLLLFLYVRVMTRQRTSCINCIYFYVCKRILLILSLASLDKIDLRFGHRSLVFFLFCFFLMSLFLSLSVCVSVFSFEIRGGIHHVYVYVDNHTYIYPDCIFSFWLCIWISCRIVIVCTLRSIILDSALAPHISSFVFFDWL